MKGEKFRYDEKKLSKDSSLKKQIAMFLAKEYLAEQSEKINLLEIVAFGSKIRPFAAYSEKDLVKAFDDRYMNIFAKIDAYKKELEDFGTKKHYRDTWKIREIEHRINALNNKLKEMQPMLDELLENEFSS